MRTLWMVVVVLLVGIGASGCSRKRIVIVPQTTEGLKCERECMQVFHSCQAGNGRNAPVCRNEQQSCRETCPGAYFKDGAKARGGVASQVDEREGGSDSDMPQQ